MQQLPIHRVYNNIPDNIVSKTKYQFQLNFKCSPIQKILVILSGEEKRGRLR